MGLSLSFSRLGFAATATQPGADMTAMPATRAK